MLKSEFDNSQKQLREVSHLIGKWRVEFDRARALWSASRAMDVDGTISTIEQWMTGIYALNVEAGTWARLHPQVALAGQKEQGPFEVLGAIFARVAGPRVGDDPMLSHLDADDFVYLSDLLERIVRATKALADEVARATDLGREIDSQYDAWVALRTAPPIAPFSPPPGGSPRRVPTLDDLPDPFVALSPQSRDRALLALRDHGGGPGTGTGPGGGSAPPVLPGSNPFGIPIGRSSRFPDFGGGRKMPGGGRPGDNPFTAPGPKPFAPVRGLTPPRNPTSSPGRRPDTGPNPAPPKSTGGGTTAPNPPAERSTDPKGAALEGRSDPEPVTETKTVTPAPTTDAKAPPASTETSSGSGGTTTDSKDDKKSKDGTKDSTLRRPIWPGGAGTPNPEDDGSGTGGPRANPNPENSGGGLRGASVMRIASRNGVETRERDFSAGDDDGDLVGIGDRVFDPKLFRFRVPGALGDMPSDQNPNPEDQGRGRGGLGGPRAYGSTEGSSLAGPRSYDAYPDPETTGAGGPRGRYNERPNPEDTAGPRGPNARNRSAIGPWSASRNRMI